MATEIYRGCPTLIHVEDGKRNAAGEHLAAVLTQQMRQHALGVDDHQRASLRLCPGCYMVVGFDMMLHLADQNGQSRKELARSMMGAFSRLLDEGTGYVEDIHVYLDPD